MAKLIDLELKGFDELRDRLDDKKFEKRLKREVAKATKRNALVAEAYIKRGINRGARYEPNSVITIAIKGSSRPLVDTGALSASITSRVKWDVAFIGVLRSTQRKSRDGNSYDLLNVAFVVHEGAAIRVTDKMRRFFALMARENPGRWFPIRPGTKIIRIPGRPFLEAALDDNAVKTYRRNWERAIQRALTRAS